MIVVQEERYEVCGEEWLCLFGDLIVGFGKVIGDDVEVVVVDVGEFGEDVDFKDWVVWFQECGGVVN